MHNIIPGRERTFNASWQVLPELHEPSEVFLQEHLCSREAPGRDQNFRMFLQEHLPRRSCAPWQQVERARFSGSTYLAAHSRVFLREHLPKCLVTASVTNVPAGTRGNQRAEKSSANVPAGTRDAFCT